MVHLGAVPDRPQHCAMTLPSSECPDQGTFKHCVVEASTVPQMLLSEACSAGHFRGRVAASLVCYEEGQDHSAKPDACL